MRTHPVDVLVVGAGAAGLRAAIEAKQAGGEVLVLTKRRRLDAHTVLASGGTNAVLGTVDREDSWEQHFADTVREGYFLSDPRVVEVVVREGGYGSGGAGGVGLPVRVHPGGGPRSTVFGAHRWRRTCYAGDWTGRAIMTTLSTRARELDIPVVEDQYVSRLLVNEARASAPSPSTSMTAAAPPSWPTRWCCAAAATRACGGAAHRGETRTSATGSS